MKDPLKKFVIAVTGDFGKERCHDTIKRWVTKNGGEWATSITERTTHLICSIKHWKKQVDMVRLARMEKECKIVAYDWLEDSLLKRTRKREGPYLLQRLEPQWNKAKLDRKEKEKKDMKKDVTAFEQGCNNAHADLLSGMSNQGALAKWSAHAVLQQDDSQAKAKAVTDARKKYKAALKRAKAPVSGSVESPGVHDKPIMTPVGLKGTTQSRQQYAQDDPRKSQSPLVSACLIPNQEGNEACQEEHGWKPYSSPAQALNQASKSVYACPAGEEKPLEEFSSPANQVRLATDNYHIYRDTTGFDYDLMLTRIDYANNLNERYQLRLYESHSYPHTYCTHLRYSRPTRLPKTQILCHIGSPFADAFAAFTKAFRGKTRLHWDERFQQHLVPLRLYKEGEGGTFGGLNGGGVGPGTPIGELKPWLEGTTSIGNLESTEANYKQRSGYIDGVDKILDVRVMPFKYQPPPEGEPRGIMPGVELPKERMWRWPGDGCTI